MDSRLALRRLLPLTAVICLAALTPTAHAAVNVSETSHDFGSQDITTLSGTHTFTLTNDDLLDGVVVKGETFVQNGTDPGADDFLISSTTCGGTLAANGGTCEIRVRFVPSASGARSAVMQIVTDGPTVDDVTLSGTGTTLLQGPPGEKGDKGDKGDQGDQGIQGIQGIQGLKGDKGDQGLQGVQGSIGPQGDQGIQGVQGLTGDPGPTGAGGPIGPKGAQGPPGRDAIIACKVARTKRTKKLKVVCTVEFANSR